MGLVLFALCVLFEFGCEWFGYLLRVVDFVGG